MQPPNKEQILTVDWFWVWGFPPPPNAKLMGKQHSKIFFNLVALSPIRQHCIVGEGGCKGRVYS